MALRVWYIYESNFISETEKLFEIADYSIMIRYAVYIFFVNVWDFNWIFSVFIIFSIISYF